MDYARQRGSRKIFFVTHRDTSISHADATRKFMKSDLPDPTLGWMILFRSPKDSSLDLVTENLYDT